MTKVNYRDRTTRVESRVEQTPVSDDSGPRQFICPNTHRYTRSEPKGEAMHIKRYKRTSCWAPLYSKQIRVLAGGAVPIGDIPEAARAVALGAGP